MAEAPWALRIALLTHSVLARGGVVHALELGCALAGLGVAVDLLAPVEPGQTLFRALPGELPIRFHPIAMTVPPGLGLRDQVGHRIAVLEQALRAWLQGDGAHVDLLHAQDSLNGQALARIGPRVPWVRTVHHLDEFADPDLLAWQDGAWRQASAVCCVSDGWMAQLRAQRSGVYRVFNGVDLDRFHPRGPDSRAADQAVWKGLRLDPAHQPYVLTVGGIEERKNSTRLLRAFARLRAELPAACQARLVIVGGASLLQHGAEMRRWQAALSETGLHEGPEGAVLRTGPLPDQALPALMRGARLLAMPSLLEGFGLVAIEALACGTPVLVADRVPFTEHLRGSPGVAWCDPEDEASVAIGLARAWTLPRLASAPPVCRLHSWRRSAAAHLDVYQQLLERGSAPRDLLAA